MAPGATSSTILTAPTKGGPMYTRIAQCNVQPGRFDEVSRVLRDEILTELSRQPGFVDLIALQSDLERDRLVSITLWKSKEDAERYGREVFPRLTGRISSLTSNWTVHSYNVEASTVHRIGAVKAA